MSAIYKIQIQNTNKNLYSAKFVDKTRQRRYFRSSWPTDLENVMSFAPHDENFHQV